MLSMFFSAIFGLSIAVLMGCMCVLAAVWIEDCVTKHIERGS